MARDSLKTAFAQHQQPGADEVARQARLIQEHVDFTLINAMAANALIVNANRQVVFASERFLSLLGKDEKAEVLGKRPGELFGCERIWDADTGCGTRDGCRYCGALKVVLASLEGCRSQGECRLATQAGNRIEAYDLQVWGTPMEVVDESFVLVVIQDISHEKRRRSLERIFFHDILNTAGGMRNIMQLLAANMPDHLREYADLVLASSTQLVDEINSQKLLLAAESNELNFQPMALNSTNCLEMAKSYGERLEASKDRVIAIDPASKDLSVVSDYTLLRRCMGNLVKNALEASEPGETVAIGCSAGEEHIILWVHNKAVMAEEVQMQLFQRSFSTKGVGRGLGAYSVKLLVENYLRGRVDFESTEARGTIFRIHIPRTSSNVCRVGG